MTNEVDTPPRSRIALATALVTSFCRLIHTNKSDAK